MIKILTRWFWINYFLLVLKNIHLSVIQHYIKKLKQLFGLYFKVMNVMFCILFEFIVKICC